MVTERERFWACFAFFLVNFLKNGINPKLFKESIEWTERFIETYSEEN